MIGPEWFCLVIASSSFTSPIHSGRSQLRIVVTEHLLYFGGKMRTCI